MWTAIRIPQAGQAHQLDGTGHQEETTVTRHEEIRQACQAFHNANEEVWELFVKFSLEKAALGYHHFGAKSVVERIRWETSVGGSEPDLKFNDHYVPFYSRRFNRMYPHLGDGQFFRVREQTSHRTAATGRDAFQVVREGAPGRSATTI